MEPSRLYERLRFVDAFLWDGSEEAHAKATEWGMNSSLMHEVDQDQTWWIVRGDSGTALPMLDEVLRGQYFTPDDPPPWSE